MLELRLGTAVVIPFGPAVSNADGVTPVATLVTALDHATTGIKISKNGGVPAVRHATVTASVYTSYGIYRVTLDTTDTGTKGTLKVVFTDPTTNYPMVEECMVMDTDAWDRKYNIASAALAPVNTKKINDVSITGDGSLTPFGV